MSAITEASGRQSELIAVELSVVGIGEGPVGSYDLTHPNGEMFAALDGQMDTIAASHEGLLPCGISPSLRKMWSKPFDRGNGPHLRSCDAAVAASVVRRRETWRQSLGQKSAKPGNRV
jgi:hypothetical protein